MDRDSEIIFKDSFESITFKDNYNDIVFKDSFEEIVFDFFKEGFGIGTMIIENTNIVG